MNPDQVRTLWATFVPTALYVLWLVVYDVWTYNAHGNESTISYVTWKLAREWPIFTWLVGLIPGVLAGHFFWPQDKGGAGASHLSHDVPPPLDDLSDHHA